MLVPMRVLGFGGAALLAASIVVACAIGSNDEPFDDNPFPDAGRLEASTIPGPDDAGGIGPETDSGKSDSGGPVNEACQNALSVLDYDFTNEQGWTHKISDGASGSWPFDPWSHGTSAALACPTGSCWGAELTQNYAQCQRGELVSPKIDLSACKGSKVALVFKHAYDFWSGSYNGTMWFDGGIVEISSDDGAIWVVPTATFPGTVKINPDRGASYACLLKDQFHVHNKPGFTGKQTNATTMEIELGPSALTDSFRVRFSQASGVSSQTTNANTSRSATGPGWRIDDVHFVMK